MDVRPQDDLAPPLDTELTTLIDDLGAKVDSRRAELDELRHLPRDLLDDTVSAGLFDMLTPFGDDDQYLVEWFRASMRVAWWNGSHGWLVAQGSTPAPMLAVGAPEFYQRLKGEVAVPVFAATNAGVMDLAPRDDEWLVNGTIRLASGCKGATHILGMGLEVGASPAPENFRYVIAPADRWKIVEDWDAIGLCGTGSHSIQADNLAIPQSDSMSVLAPPITDGPERVFSIVIGGAFPISYAVAATQLGCARRALDEATAIAAEKLNVPEMTALDSRDTVRAELMELEGLWYQAATACAAALQRLWAAALDGAVPDDRQRALQATVAHLANKRGREVVERVWSIVGTSALAPDHPIARAVRDTHTLAGHVSANDAVLLMAAARLRGETPSRPIA